MTTMTTSTLTTDQLTALRTEAAEHGDLEQVAICDLALSGDAEALSECARVIADAAAQDDDREAETMTTTTYPVIPVLTGDDWMEPGEPVGRAATAADAESLCASAGYSVLGADDGGLGAELSDPWGKEPRWLVTVLGE